MFEKIGAKLTGEVGLVYFCRVLTLEGNPSAHMVLKGQKGPINVIFIKNHLITEPQPFNHHQFEGIILPAPQANIAIVGLANEPLNLVAQRLNQVIHWL